MTDLKILICDVGNAASAIVTVPTGYSMMIDCICHLESPSKADLLNNCVEFWGVTYRK